MGRDSKCAVSLVKWLNEATEEKGRGLSTRESRIDQKVRGGIREIRARDGLNLEGMQEIN